MQLLSVWCPPVKNFNFDIQHTMICAKCCATSIITEPYNHISLDIPCNELTPHTLSIQELVHDFFDVDEVEKQCESCGNTIAALQHKMVTFPRVLILHLKRFLVDLKEETYHKIKDKVKADKTLNLGMFCSSIQR